jgi:hypothetical protein
MMTRDPALSREFLRAVGGLSDDQLRLVLKYATDLASSNSSQSPVVPARKSLLGSLSHLKATVSEADIAEARREMWGESAGPNPTEPPGHP